MLIGLDGKMGVGKSTAIAIIKEHFKFQDVVCVKFAQPLYDMQEYIYNRISSVYTRGDDFVKDRKLLQWLGTEWGRDSISKTLWGDIWQKKADYVLSTGGIVVSDDVRFDNEAARVKSMGGVIINITSNRSLERITTANGIPGHSSESGIDAKYVDAYVKNDGTIEEFKGALDIALRSLL